MRVEIHFNTGEIRIFDQNIREVFVEDEEAPGDGILVRLPKTPEEWDNQNGIIVEGM